MQLAYLRAIGLSLLVYLRAFGVPESNWCIRVTVEEQFDLLNGMVFLRSDDSFNLRKVCQLKTIPNAEENVEMSIKDI